MNKTRLIKRIFAAALSIVIMISSAFMNNNITFAMEYESSKTVIITNKFEKSGIVVINGKVQINNAIPQLSDGIYALLNSKTLIYDNFEYGNNEYVNTDSILSDTGVKINAGKVQLSNVIAAKQSVQLGASDISSDESVIIYSENGNVTLSAGMIAFNGIIYAPNGEVRIEASDVKINGKIIAKSVKTSTGCLEINGNPKYDTVQENLEFLSDDLLLKVNVKYDEENKKYSLKLLDGEESMFRTLEIYARYNNNSKLEKICDYAGDTEFNLSTGYVTADIVLKGCSISGKTIYSNISSFSVDEEGVVLYSRIDTDMDRIIDGVELLITNTNPYDPDSDGDGIDDYAECFFLYTDPHSMTEDADDDKDGLSNIEEIEKGTNPFLMDCDMDGLLDGQDDEPLVTSSGYTVDGKDIVVTKGKYDIVINGYDENGNIYQYVYDPINELIKANCYNDVEILHFYDEKNNKITDIRKYSQGERINSCKYDEDRNVTVYSNHGNVYEFSYNDMGGVVSTTLNGNNITVQDYENNIITYGNGDCFYAITDEKKKSSYINDRCADVTTYDENGNTVCYEDNEANIIYNYDYTDDNIIVKRIYNNLGYCLEYSYTDEKYNVKYSYNEDQKTQTIGLQDSKSNVKSTLISGTEYVRDENENECEVSISSEDGEMIVGSEYIMSDGQIVETQINNDSVQYSYNDNGQIIAIKRGEEFLIEYTYNMYGQLVKTVDYVNGTVEEYTYDLYNNIGKVELYDNVNHEIIKSDSYIYDDSEYSDRISAYNGQKFVYDEIGNPIEYINNASLDWTGRLLSAVSNNNGEVKYTYSPSGMRTSKELNGERTYFFYDGSDVVAELRRDDCIWYIYDDSTRVIGFIYQNQDYYYIKNAMNDVMSIVDDKGNFICGYEYDAWGNITEVYGDESIANANPFRYKSYYYDAETGWYYLQTRYYDPELRRFISMDDASDVVEESIDPNLYAYCCNDPVNMSDPTGRAAVKIAIFTITSFENESEDYLRDSLLSSFSANSPSISITTSNKKEKFTEWWNSRINYDVIFVNTHGTPTLLTYTSDPTSKILDSVAEVGDDSYKNLNKSNVKIVVLLGCNCGHWNYLDKNVAYRLATRLNRGIVMASDGTVFANEEYHLFSRNDIYYESRADKTYRKLIRDNPKYTDINRDSYGWMTYSKVMGRGWTFGVENLRTSFVYNLYKNNSYLKYK